MALDPSPYAATPPVAPAPSPAPKRTGRALVGLALIVALLLATGGVSWAIVASADHVENVQGQRANGSSGQSTTPATPPDQWDPRLAPLADFVATTRGKPFDHPVPAEFLDDAAFRERIKASDEELTDEDRANLDVFTAQLRALGLIGDGVDVFGETQQLMGEGTAAFYDSKRGTITVRGSELNVAARVTLVHELTHAWQDQHTNLDRSSDMSDAQASNFRTLVEGDASDVEEAYRAQLSSAEQQQYDEEWGAQVDNAENGMKDVPDVMKASFTSPYIIGPAFISILNEEGGNSGIDAALDDPPKSDVELLDPIRWFNGPKSVDVNAPKLTSGQDKLDEAEFGAMSLLLTLAQRVDPRVALKAADGWAGDDSVTYRQDGRSCLAVATLAVDEAAADKLQSATQQWADAGPSGAASVERAGRQVTLRSCDVAGQTTPAGDQSSAAVQYAALRLTVFQQILQTPRVTLDQAACFADNITQQVTPEEIRQNGSISEAEGRRRGAQAALACLD